MLWVLLSVLAASFSGIRNIFAKKLVQKYDEYLLSFTASITTVLCLSPFISLNEFSTLSRSFFISLIITGVINAMTLVLILRALKHTELSLVSPIFAFSPILLLITSPVIIKEYPSMIGIFGVFIILIGTYILNFEGKVNFEFFTKILKHKGQKIIFIVTILWAISSNFYKIGMQNSSPLFFIFALNFVITILLLPTVFQKKQIKIIKTDFKYLIILGVLSALTSVFQWNAANLNSIVYVLSIKRSSILISVIGGIVFFNEKGSVQKIISTMVVLVGIFLITYY